MLHGREVDSHEEGTDIKQHPLRTPRGQCDRSLSRGGSWERPADQRAGGRWKQQRCKRGSVPPEALARSTSRIAHRSRRPALEVRIKLPGKHRHRTRPCTSEPGP